MRPARIHNLRGNKVERSPHRLFVWDTETRTSTLGAGELLSHRVWAAETVQRHGRRPTRPARQRHQGDDPERLVDALEGSCRSSETLWAFAHNQGFDLTVSRLLLRLLGRGWTLTDHALTTASPWARLVRGSHRLVLADSTSWLPVPLAELGRRLVHDKPPLPDEEDGQEDWWHRCREDVSILVEALLQLLDWWDAQRLGSWSVTGPQTGFNLMRHKPQQHKVVIDPDPEARAFERLALMGGRREVWRLGRQPWGDYRELDFRMAHATIAARCPLPKRRSVHFESMDVDDWRLSSERWAPIAWAVLRTGTPRYPLQHRGRLFYPIGTFCTVLCGPELREARRRGELVSVGPGYVYQLGGHMMDWGAWVLDQLDQPDPATPEVARVAIKAWSRQVPGKWAARTGRLLQSGPAAEQGWGLEHGRHHPSGAPVATLDIAGRREVVLQDQDADDCFPAVLAWIQSEVRVRLGRLIDHFGADLMLSCNTDGVIVADARWHEDSARVVDLAPLQVREKARHEWLDVISPQHLVLPSERRLSGVPASAEEVAPHQFSWLTWPRLPGQIASGSPQGYVRQRRSVDLREVPVNRWVLADGLCLPVQAELGEDGQTRLQPLQPWFPAGRPEALRPGQHPLLEKVLAGG